MAVAVAVPVLAVFEVVLEVAPAADSAPAAFASPEVVESPPDSAGGLASAAAGGGGSAMAADLMGRAGGSRGQLGGGAMCRSFSSLNRYCVAGKDTAL